MLLLQYGKTQGHGLFQRLPLLVKTLQGRPKRRCPQRQPLMLVARRPGSHTGLKCFAVHLYTAAETRELDRLAIAEGGLPGIVLMKRAGRAAWQLLRERWPNARSITVVSGGGNNGGDGYVLAALAAQKRHRVQVFWLAEPGTLSGDAARAWGPPFVEGAGSIFAAANRGKRSVGIDQVPG